MPGQKYLNRFWVVAIMAVVLSAVAYLPSWRIAPLLDEYFILAWAKKVGSRGVPWADFFFYSGLRPDDLWQWLTPLSLKVSAVTSFGAVWLWRIQNTLLHASVALGLFYAGRALGGKVCAWLSMVLFVFNPVAVESVVWLGGRGQLLSGLFLTWSLVAYLKSRNVTSGRYGSWSMSSLWRWLLLSAALYLAALMSSLAALSILPLLIVVEIALWLRSGKSTANAGTVALMLPLLFLIITAVSLVVQGDIWSLAGGRPWYVLTMSGALLCGLVLTTLASFLDRFGARQVAAAMALLVLIVSGVFLSRSWKHLHKYHNAASTVRRLLKSFRVVHDKTRAPYVVAEAIPAGSAIASDFAAIHTGVFEPKIGLLAANRISGGALKDTLRSGRFANCLLRWEPALNDFVQPILPVDTEVEPVNFDAQELATQFLPPIEHYKTARLQDSQIEMVSNNPTTGPVMRLNGSWLSPFAADFIWIDAQIDAPNTGARSTIDCYFQSGSHPNFDFKHRKSTAPALVSDGRYHRYYIPLRSVGFVLGEQPTEVTIGFPAGATVKIRGLGTETRDHLTPLVTIDGGSGEKPVSPPCFGFPDDPRLGLFTVLREAQALTGSFDCANLPAAEGLVLQISQPDRDFEQVNSNTLSGVTYRTIPVSGLAGKFEIPLEKFSRTGIYAIAGIATDRQQHFVGNFSDTCYVYVWRPKKTAWSTEP